MKPYRITIDIDYHVYEQWKVFIEKMYGIKYRGASSDIVAFNSKFFQDKIEDELVKYNDTKN